MDIDTLKNLIDGPHDSAMLRLTLARQLLELEHYDDAIMHLEHAIHIQPEYSAAWKWLGKAQQQNDQLKAARQTYNQAITIAKKNGDKQSEKEIVVFLRRLDKQLNTS